MRASAILSVLFAVGALAAPFAPRELKERDTVVDVVVQTVTKTITIGGSGPTPTSKAKQEADGNINQFIHRPRRGPRRSTSKPVVQPPAPTPSPSTTTSTTPKAEPQPSTPAPPKEEPSTPATNPTTPPSGGSGDDGSPLSGGVSLLSTANKYRASGKPKFTWSTLLAGNAAKAAANAHGTLTHQLNKGSFGQVISPGAQEWGSGFDKSKAQGDSPFEVTYVAWLCEVPSDPILKNPVDQCAVVDTVLHMSYSSTGHYDILTSANYKQIGCAFAGYPDGAHGAADQGLWFCDVA